MRPDSPPSMPAGADRAPNRLSVFDRRTAEELTALLRLLDANDPQLDPAKQDETAHWSYRKRLQLTIRDDAGPPQTCQVQSRTLSRRTLKVLGPMMVYPGVACRVQLITGHNMWHDVDGRVVNCRYAGDRAYELTVALLERIDVELFVPHAAAKRVLVVDDESTSRGLLSIQLKRLNADVTAVSSGAEALDAVGRQEFDVVFIDLQMPSLSGPETLAELRNRGFRGRCIAVTSYDSGAAQDEAFAQGFDAFFTKPATPDKLSDALHSSFEPVLSSLAGDTEMRPLLKSFVEQLPDQVAALQAAAEAQDAGTIRKLLLGLRADAGGCGFEPVAEQADAVLALLEDPAVADKVPSAVRDVIQLARMVRLTHTD